MGGGSPHAPGYRVPPPHIFPGTLLPVWLSCSLIVAGISLPFNKSLLCLVIDKYYSMLLHCLIKYI